MARRGRNEGSIHLRQDGRWAATVELGRQGGKRKRKTFYGKTRRAVQEQLTAALKATADGLPLPTGKLTVAAYARTWLEGIRPSIRPNTYAGYESILRVHIVPATRGRSARQPIAVSLGEALHRSTGQGAGPKKHSCLQFMRPQHAR